MYFCDMITNLPTYDEARKAIRGGKDPMAFLHLGIIYANGIGITQNHALANYFFDKAAALGCEDAYGYIIKEYETCARDLANSLEKDLSESISVSAVKLNRYRSIAETIRTKKNYGLLSRIRKFIPILYPDYNQEKATTDILNDCDSMDADIYYSQSTCDNRSEIDIKLQDRLLEQLYAPVTQDRSLLRDIKERNDVDVLSQETIELLQAIFNYTNAYDAICRENGINPKEIMTVKTMDLMPYIKVSTFFLLRKQVFRCLLSIKDVDPLISEEFLTCLDSDELLLNVCEKIKDQDLQLFLISFVEINIDLDTLEIETFGLLNAYRNKNMAPLANYLNAYIERLTCRNIDHHLPVFSAEDLPTIRLSESRMTRGMDTVQTGAKGKYSILQNDNGEIMVMIDAKESEPEDPRFIYDGKMALLFRNFDSNVLLRNIAPEAHQALQEVDEVLVVEVLNDDVEREYVAPIRLVKDVNSLIV